MCCENDKGNRSGHPDSHSPTTPNHEKPPVALEHAGHASERDSLAGVGWLWSFSLREWKMDHPVPEKGLVVLAHGPHVAHLQENLLALFVHCELRFRRPGEAGNLAVGITPQNCWQGENALV